MVSSKVFLKSIAVPADPEAIASFPFDAIACPTRLKLSFENVAEPLAVKFPWGEMVTTVEVEAFLTPSLLPSGSSKERSLPGRGETMFA